MKAILRKAKNKYKGLERGISLDSLCGNKFWKNEMTVTKYLCGMIILHNFKRQKANKLENNKLLPKSTMEIKLDEQADKKETFCYQLGRALNRKPIDFKMQMTKMSAPPKLKRSATSLQR